MCVCVCVCVASDTASAAWYVSFRQVFACNFKCTQTDKDKCTSVQMILALKIDTFLYYEMTDFTTVSQCDAYFIHACMKYTHANVGALVMGDENKCKMILSRVAAVQS